MVSHPGVSYCRVQSLQTGSEACLLVPVPSLRYRTEDYLDPVATWLVPGILAVVSTFQCHYSATTTISISGTTVECVNR